MSTIKIALANNNGTEHILKLYQDWIRKDDRVIENIISMNDADAFEILENMDGLILTGGSDVSQEFYKSEKPNLIGRVDLERDNFEKRLLDIAFKKEMPILGICRGMQFVNTYLGGSLYEDLESYNFKNHRSSDHQIKIVEDSLLFNIANQNIGNINSHHHQAVRNLAEELRASSFSDDGVVESAEWKNYKQKQFMILVQWHPEKMIDDSNPMSKNIRENFINAAEFYSQKINNKK